MPTVEELFARSFVINLDTATDRMALLAKSFGRAGLPVPRRFGACHLRKLEYNPWWRRIPGGRHHAANVSASHLQCVHAAQALGWPFVFVFEDDAWPCRDALDVLGRELQADGAVVPGLVRPAGPRVRRRVVCGRARLRGVRRHVRDALRRI